ncbi:hypothetical protein RB195_007702 [Necator americanus]|uniref:Uncharacterized protein n=1 Tax=Necator americanus TaxID=51031 RepID=A0ABR1C024_NECAM
MKRSEQYEDTGWHIGESDDFYNKIVIETTFILKGSYSIQRKNSFLFFRCLLPRFHIDFIRIRNELRVSILYGISLYCWCYMVS